MSNLVICIEQPTKQRALLNSRANNKYILLTLAGTQPLLVFYVNGSEMATELLFLPLGILLQPLKPFVQLVRTEGLEPSRE